MRPSASTSAISPRRDGALVAGADRAQRLGRGVGVDLHGLAALEADVQPAHHGPVHQHERLGGGDLAVDARGVGGGEDLLGRQVRHVHEPVGALEARGLPGVAGQQPDGQVGARALVVQRVEAALGQALGGRDEEVRARAPGGDRVVLVEAADVEQVASSCASAASGVEVGEDDLRPRGRRAGRDRPVRRAVVDDLAGLLERREAVAADARGVEVLEQAGGDRAREADARGADLAEREQALAVPVGDEVEVLLARVLDAGALDPGIEVLDVDELGAVAVRARRDGADHELLARLAGDRDDLPGLHVGAESDDHVGEALEGGVVHAPRLYAADARCAVSLNDRSSQRPPGEHDEPRQ